MVTGEMVEQLILNGADIVKVGIGPGRYLIINKTIISSGCLQFYFLFN